MHVDPVVNLRCCSSGVIYLEDFWKTDLQMELDLARKAKTAGQCASGICLCLPGNHYYRSVHHYYASLFDTSSRDRG